MEAIIEQLSTQIIQFVSSNGYLAVFILMSLESALLPIPSEITMPFAGFLVSQGKLDFWVVVAIGGFANLVGSLIAYALGYFLEENIIVNLIRRYGKFVLITEHEYLRAVHWFQKYGSPIAFFSRLMPAVRTFISLPAGLAEMNIWKFSIYTLTGSLIWSAFLTYIGFTLGKNWHDISPYYRKVEYFLAALVVVGVLWYLNHKLKIVKFKR